MAPPARSLQSRLFQEEDVTSPDYAGLRQAIGGLVSLSPTSRERCMEEVTRFWEARGPAQRRRTFDALVEAGPESPTMIAGAVEALTFFAQRLADERYGQDPSAAIADDLVTLEVIGPQDRSTLDGVLRTVSSRLASRYERAERLRQYTQGVLPSLVAVGATVEIRAVLRHGFDSSKPLEAYEPVVEDTVGVVSVALSTDADENSRFYFQADRSELGLMIDTLRAAQKELDALERRARTGMPGAPAPDTP